MNCISSKKLHIKSVYLVIVYVFRITSIIYMYDVEPIPVLHFLHVVMHCLIHFDTKKFKTASMSGMITTLADRHMMITPKVIPMIRLDVRGSLALFLFLMLDDRLALATVRFLRMSVNILSNCSTVGVVLGIGTGSQSRSLPGELLYPVDGTSKLALWAVNTKRHNIQFQIWRYMLHDLVGKI